MRVEPLTLLFLSFQVDTPYQGGVFRVKLKLGADFPSVPPKGFFLTKIFHPNVAKNGEICVNTLKRDWKEDLGIGHILLVRQTPPPIFQQLWFAPDTLSSRSLHRPSSASSSTPTQSLPLTRKLASCSLRPTTSMPSMHAFGPTYTPRKKPRSEPALHPLQPHPAAQNLSLQTSSPPLLLPARVQQPRKQRKDKRRA